MPTPRKINGNSKGEGGFQKPNFLNESMTPKWNFWRGGGLNFKKPSVRGVWIFSGTTQFPKGMHSSIPVSTGVWFSLVQVSLYRLHEKTQGRDSSSSFYPDLKLLFTQTNCVHFLSCFQ